MATPTNTAPAAAKHGFARSLFDAILLVGTAARVSHDVRIGKAPSTADLKKLGIDHPLTF